MSASRKKKPPGGPRPPTVRATVRARARRAALASRPEPRRRTEPAPHLEAARLVQEIRSRREDLSRSVENLQQYWSRVQEWDAEQAATRAALADAHSRFGEFYDFVPTPFLLLDAGFRIAQANTAGTQLLASVNGRALGQPLIAYVDGADMRPLTALLMRARPEEPAQLEVRLRARGGWIPAHVIVRSGGAARETRTYYAAIVDLSEVRRLEQERAQADEERRRSLDGERAALAAAKAKDDFIAMLSHELRTPLTPILAAADALRGNELPEPLRDAVAIIRRNVVIESRLIDDLLDLARLTTKRLKVETTAVSLHSVIDLVLADWAAEATRAGIDVRLELGATSERVEVDAGRIAQVLRNVLGNALKFTEAGGRVTVSTEDGDGFVRVCVTDTGAGMSAAQVARLFEPFAESRTQLASRAGLGLGLVISHGILQAHGGRIRVHSRGQGRGSTVQIELPTTDRQSRPPVPMSRRKDDARKDDAPAAPSAPDEPSAADEPSAPAEPSAAVESAATAEASATAAPAVPVAPGRLAASVTPFSAAAGAAAPGTAVPAVPGHLPATARVAARRVLLVEDHEDSAMTLSMVLSMKGYSVTIARTVKEAEGLAAGCDLLISDISLPDGSGLDLVHHVLQQRPLPAIALSGYGSEEDQRRSRDAGFSEHLTKPVDIDHLLAAVDRLAASPSPSR